MRMRSWIKIMAVILAVVLIVSIFGGILSAISALISHLGGESVVGENKTYTFDHSVKSLKIEISAGQLKILEGEKLELSSNHKYLTAELNGDTVEITESKLLVAADYEDVVITLTIPGQITFESVQITAGAGTVHIHHLITKDLKMQLGAGQVNIQGLTATQSAKIQGGTGNLTFSDTSITNFSLEMGVGALNYSGSVAGNCSLKLGVGASKFQLDAHNGAYTITVHKGLGAAKIDGKEVADGAVYGDGSNKVTIEGGIGQIDIEIIHQTTN